MIEMNHFPSRYARFCLLLLLVSGFVSCNPEARGFALPEGDADEGRITFTELHCNQCHSIGNIPWAGLPGDVRLELGGEVTQIKSYGELLTSVINPSHKIAKKYLGEQVAEGDRSRMKSYNDVMTVQELVDLVTFLQGEYPVRPPANYYPY